MEVLVNEKDENGLTCLQLLSQMPSVFRSSSQMGFEESLIYSRASSDSTSYLFYEIYIYIYLLKSLFIRILIVIWVTCL